MMRLDEPQYSFEQTLDACSAGITGNAALRNKLTIAKPSLIGEDTRYSVAASAGELYTIAAVDVSTNPDPVVINDLKKSELIKIYDRYFVSESKPARKIYDALLNSAKEKCPFCGGIGTPRNLDHFLPKAHFPQFSIVPRNLVPSCRDCNMDGKGHAYSTVPENQFIQPYSDNDIFFLEQWIFATYHATANNVPGYFEYSVSPPVNWCDVDKQMLIKHFDDFDLAKRYATKAAEHLGTVLAQIQKLQLHGMDNAVIHTVILQPGIDNAPFINHWQNGLYQSLMTAFP